MAIDQNSTPYEVFTLPEDRHKGEIRSPITQGMILAAIWIAGSVWSIKTAESNFGQDLNALFIFLMIYLWFNVIFSVVEIIGLAFRHRYLRQQWDRIDGGLRGRGAELFGEALKTPVNHRNLFDTKAWCNGFIAWGIMDRDYATQNGFGYIAELGNGAFSFWPNHLMIMFLVGATVSPMITGMVGLAFFYQTIWGTTLYKIGLICFGNNSENSAKGNFLLIWGNLPWLVMSIVGLYAAVHMIMDNSYQVFFG